jgi:dihydroorotase
MKEISRRDLLKAGAVGTVALCIPGRGLAQQGVGAGDKFDLIVKGGEVLDPSQSLKGKFDIGIKNAKIALLAPDIPSDRAAQTIEAKGKLVTPGLVDLHAHVFPQGSAIGLPADELAPYASTTTYVSAGDAGANNFSALKHYVIAQSRCRVFGFVHISMIGLAGFPVGECLNINYCNVDLAAKTMSENEDVLLGIKVRQTKNIVGENGIEPLKRAIAAAERSGTKARVMVHIGDVPGTLGELLDLLRPGDIVAHMFSGTGNNIVQGGKVIPQAFEAKKRGVLMEIAHGGGSFDYTIAEPAIQQGLLPDCISSDIHGYSANSPGKPFMPWIMSKFWNMGFTLEEVVALSTVKPAKIIGKVDKLGTLQVGAPADVSIFEIMEEPVKFVDTMKNFREGNRYLKPVQTIRAGRPFGGPYPSPFMFP